MLPHAGSDPGRAWFLSEWNQAWLFMSYYLAAGL
jgi:hypothetical protein